jgi:hypothetical protein
MPYYLLGLGLRFLKAMKVNYIIFIHSEENIVLNERGYIMIQKIVTTSISRFQEVDVQSPFIFLIQSSAIHKAR